MTKAIQGLLDGPAKKERAKEILALLSEHKPILSHLGNEDSIRLAAVQGALEQIAAGTIGGAHISIADYLIALSKAVPAIRREAVMGRDFYDARDDEPFAKAQKTINVTGHAVVPLFQEIAQKFVSYEPVQEKAVAVGVPR